MHSVLSQNEKVTWFHNFKQYIGHFGREKQNLLLDGVKFFYNVYKVAFDRGWGVLYRVVCKYSLLAPLSLPLDKYNKCKKV